jgi:hypothetical protein
MATLSGRDIGDVGVLPQVAARVQELADQPTSTGQEIAAVVIRDPSLTSKLLRLINSAAFGLRGEVRSIRHAVGGAFGSSAGPPAGCGGAPGCPGAPGPGRRDGGGVRPVP